MKALYESIRDRQAAVIAQNPVSIVITRKTRALQAVGAGGLAESTATLAAQTFRLYFKSQTAIIASESLTVQQAGHNKSKAAKMIGAYNADVKSKTAVNIDSFTLDGKAYQITDVIDVKTQNQTVYKEIFMELLNG